MDKYEATLFEQLFEENEMLWETLSGFKSGAEFEDFVEYYYGDRGQMNSFVSECKRIIAKNKKENANDE